MPMLADTALVYENPRYTHELATEILGLVMQHRRVPHGQPSCGDHRCPKCAAQHVSRIVRAIEHNEAITFVLPAFPGKSPNPGKVLGPRADMAERQSLAFLDSLCQRIEKIYAPGARI